VGGTLAGSAITGGIALRVASNERRARDRDDLRRAVVSYWNAMERLRVELQMTPTAPPSGLGRVIGRVGVLERVRRLALKTRVVKAIMWGVDLLTRRLFAKEIVRTLDEFHSTGRYLVLIGPESIKRTMLDAADLAERAKERDDDAWWPEWDAMRDAFVSAAREELAIAF
jgi:hypothetical protein